MLVTATWQMSYGGKKKDVQGQPAQSWFCPSIIEIDRGMMKLPWTPLARRPGPHLGSGNLWNIFLICGGQRDHPLLGSGPSSTLSGDLTVYLCQALTVIQNGETKTSYILSRTFNCGLQAETEHFFPYKYLRLSTMN